MKAVLFGSIGTVAETSEIQRRSYNLAFKRLNIEPEFGQWAVMILFFNLISAKNRLYLFIKTPGINSFSKSIFK